MSYSYGRQISICVLLLIIFSSIETWTNLDLSFQELFYTPSTKTWSITPHIHEKWKLLLYTGPKILIIIAAALSLTAFISSFINQKLQYLRRPCLFFFLSILLIPITVASLKQVTNIYSPSQLYMFNGNYPYLRIFTKASPETNQLDTRGKSFPAGHATGGFALMSLAFLGTTRRMRIAGFMVGFLIGWTMGIYQVLRGEHFFSHTLTTMLLSWIIITILAIICKPNPYSIQKNI